jgi:Uma2 family endonuclease
MSTDARRMPERAVDAGRVPYRFTAAQVLKMSDDEVFGGDDVELWDGALYKMVKGELHNAVVYQVAELIRPAVPRGYHLREEKSCTSTEDTLPEPDVAVIRGGPFASLPLPPPLSKLALVVEVSVSTHRADAGEKLQRYAGAGIPVYWQVDPSARVIRVRAGPTTAGKSARYAKSRTYGIGQALPIVIDGEEVGRVPVADLFPPGEP